MRQSVRHKERNQVLTLLEGEELLLRKRESRAAHVKHRLGQVLDAIVLEVEEPEVGASVVELVNLLLVSGFDLGKVDDEERMAFQVGGEVGSRVLDVDGRHGCGAVACGRVGES